MIVKKSKLHSHTHASLSRYSCTCFHDHTLTMTPCSASSLSACRENTLHDLQQQRAGNPLVRTHGLLVTDLDPDAAMRHGRHLADLDSEDEARLLKYLFAHIRAGQLDKVGTHIVLQRTLISRYLLDKVL